MSDPSPSSSDTEEMEAEPSRWAAIWESAEPWYDLYCRLHSS